MSLEEIFQEVRKYKCKLILLTGGDPLHQTKECWEFVHRLNGIDILIETSGAYHIKPVMGLPRVRVNMDVKTPSSGVLTSEYESIVADNMRLLTGKDEVKFVVGDRSDYEYSRKFLATWEEVFDYVPVYISPVWEAGQEFWRKLQGWMLEDRLVARFSLQQHKCVWDSTKRGV